MTQNIHDIACRVLQSSQVAEKAKQSTRTIAASTYKALKAYASASASALSAPITTLVSTSTNESKETLPMTLVLNSKPGKATDDELLLQRLDTEHQKRLLLGKQLVDPKNNGKALKNEIK